MKDFKRLEPAFEHTDGRPDGGTAIVFAFDDYFLPYGSAMIQSLIEHASEQHTYDMVVLHAGLTEPGLSKLSELTKGHPNISLRTLNIKGLTEPYTLYTGTRGKRLTTETYFRLLIGEVLSLKYTRAIYLDGDMAALTDIAALYGLELAGYYLAAAYDITGIAKSYRPGNALGYYRRKGLKLTDPDSYFIAGLLVINLPLLRQDYPGESLLELAASRQWRQHDQDVLNTICRGGKARMLHASWNVLQDFGNNCYLPEHLSNQWLESEKAPKIIHYGGKTKPWNTDMPNQEFFWKSAAQTPFFPEIAERILRDELSVSEQDFIRFYRGIEKIRIRFAEKLPLSLCTRNQLLIELSKLLNEEGDPQISVVIPVYNTGLWLEQCLDSVTGQDLKDIEIICVDDGSTDCSPAILERYASEDSRVRILTHETNRGLLAARKTGVMAARGNYILFVDSDDTIDTDLCSSVQNLIREYRTDILEYPMLKIRTESQTRTVIQPEEKCVLGDAVLSCFFRQDRIRPNLVSHVFRSEICRKAYREIPEMWCYAGEDQLTSFFLGFFSASYIGVNTDSRYNYYNGRGLCKSGKTFERFKQFCEMDQIPRTISAFLLRVNGNEAAYTALKYLTANLISNCCQYYADLPYKDKARAWKVLIRHWGRFPEFKDEVMRRFRKLSKTDGACRAISMLPGKAAEGIRCCNEYGAPYAVRLFAAGLRRKTGERKSRNENQI